MTGDAASLERLHDILMPGPVPWWPPAPGVYLVLGVLLVVALCFAMHGLRHYLRQAYRREALAAIRASRLSVTELAALLKRVALTAYPREQVAGLTGQAWLQWLTETSGLTVPPAVAEMLTRTVYTGAGAPETAELIAFIKRWIRRHRASSPES